MIVTLTLNPSLDRTIQISRFEPGRIVGVSSSTVEAGGKGINVSRALHLNGWDTTAVFPVGGGSGEHLLRLLAPLDMRLVALPVVAETRTNLTLVDSDGTVTKLNEVGGPLGESELRRLIEAGLDQVKDAQWLVMSGSLPAGVPTEVIRELRSGHGGRFAVDTSGRGLATAIAAGADLVKPNREEAESWSGRHITTLGEAVGVAQEIVRQGVVKVLLSLGRDGALLVRADVALYGRAPLERPRNTVGAGDTLLAGFLAGDEDDENSLCMALAWARAAVRSEATTLLPPQPDDFGSVSVTASFDRAIPLAESR